MVNKTRLSLLILSCLLAIQTVLAQTANNSIPAYTSPFQYGVNGAYAGTNWSDQTLAQIASNAGSNSIRVGLYDSFLEQYGNNVRTPAFNYYTNSLHFSDNIVFLNGAAGDHVDMTTYPGCSQHSMVFKNIYQPIWNVDASGRKTINPSNYFAQYVYNVVSTYGQNVKFYEIWNEPDFTYTSHGYASKGTPGNWFDNAPAPADLTNIQAPVYYYIRMLHIAYEVIKSQSPNSMVATGGLGYSSFLDVILRNTDNPDNGKVTADYPLTGGAYFDVLSFHSYPFYELGQWSNAVGKMVYTRTSDGNADRFLFDKQTFNTVLSAHQYDGSKFPAKYFICTETNVPSKSNPSSAGQYGTPELQRNYIIKTMVNAQVNGVKQLYLYALDNGPGNDPSNMNDAMGMYNYLFNVRQGQETLTDEGVAFKTVSNQLRGLTYDQGQTAGLNLPATVGGAVFSGIQNGIQTRKICIWARTTGDESEAASATISLPASLGNQFKKYSWNAGADTSAYSKIPGNPVTLSGAPIFLVPVSGNTTPPASVTANAGSNKTITLPVSTLTLDGSASTSVNTTITSYSWKQTQGAPVNMQAANVVKPVISGLAQGSYTFQLVVADNSQHSNTGSVSIVVNAATPVARVIANAGSSLSVTLPVNTALLDGSASTSQNTTITNYYWKQLTGPSQANMQSNNAAKTTITGLIQGKYIFLLKVSDNNKITDSSSVTILVNAAQTVASVKANAGPDQTLSSGSTSSTLIGTGSYATNSTITSYRWMQLAGPPNLTWGNTTTVNTNIGGLVAGGKYVFEIIVADNQGHRDSSKMNLTVNGASNLVSLIANAGPDQIITLPTTTSTLIGTASTATNTTISSYRWKELSGPANLTWQNTTTINTRIGGLVAGKYLFELIIADNSGHRDSSKMNLTVYSAQSNPVLTANAGSNQTVTLPNNTASLIGAASNAINTTISAYRWKEIAGPPNLTWQNTTTQNTNVGNLTAGIYLFELFISDNAGHRDSSKVTVSVIQPAGTIAPKTLIAHAGVNQEISLPVTTASLDGSSSIGGTDITYMWKEISGPNNGLIANPNVASTTVSGLVGGTYVFELFIQNSTGTKDSATVIISALAGKITSVMLYPNPVKSQATLKVNYSQTGPTDIEVYSTAGARTTKQVVNKTDQFMAATLDLSTLSAGIYILRVTTGKTVKTLHFIKQ